MIHKMANDKQITSKIYLTLTGALFLILFFRIIQLQLFSSDLYLRVSEKNRIRSVDIRPQRGLILDRNGAILVDNRPSYSISVIPYEILKSEKGMSLLAAILNEDVLELAEVIRENMKGGFTPVRLRKEIDFGVLSKLEEFQMQLPGVYYDVEPRRKYPKLHAAHVFGFVSELSPDEYKKRDAFYRLGDLVGKSGLESYYETILRGRRGVKYVEVDALGRSIRDLPDLDNVGHKPGAKLILTIDADLQQLAETTMDGLNGAVVVLDARTGAVLALVSKPDFDPDLFSGVLSDSSWQALVNDPDKPLYSRVCQSLYPAGSTYKLITAIAGLESGKIRLNEQITCTGSYRLGRRVFRCWKSEGHGPVDFLQAVEQSCNVYFFTKSLDIGVDDWSAYSKKFRFGEATGIDLPDENSGLAPDRSYLNAKYGERGWTQGYLLNLAIGQGDLLVTPLQMAFFAMIIANEGKAQKPHLVHQIIDPVSLNETLNLPDSIRVSGIGQSTFEVIKKAMSRVVQGVGGTAKAAAVKGVEVCGKTGTAENPHGEPHAWFIGFAPRAQPEVAFAVLVENGGSGSAVAAPIAGKVLRAYFNQQVNRK